MLKTLKNHDFYPRKQEVVRKGGDFLALRGSRKTPYGHTHDLENYAGPTCLSDILKADLTAEFTPHPGC